MLKITSTKTFKKDYVKVAKRGKDISKINHVINLLEHELPLDSRYRDHKLSGKYFGCRDCHIEPDWLLIYKIFKQELILERTGSHSDLFKK